MSIDKDLTFEVRDEYKRKPIADKIITLLESDVDISPMVIDGGWGTGKSEFCIKLINLLSSKEDVNLRSIYVDAFKAEHAEQPLMTLLASVIKLLPENEESLTSKALPVLRFGAKAVSKGAVSWLLQQDFTDVVNDLDDVIQDASDEIINATVSTMLSDHVKADENIEALVTILKELTAKKPIVIFIDELDRCRPDFAISMLESIKHVFDVDGVQFVLIANTHQLKNSVKHLYGTNMDATEYLDKFLGFRFSLPDVIDPFEHQRKYASETHFYSLIMKSELLKSSVISDHPDVMAFTKELIERNKNSLREVETFVKFLNIYQVLTNSFALKQGVFGGEGFLKIFGVYLVCFHSDILSVKRSSMLNNNSLFNILVGHEITDLTDPYSDDRNPTYCEILAASLYLNFYEHDPNSEGQQAWLKLTNRFITNSHYQRHDPHKVIFDVAEKFSLI